MKTEAQVETKELKKPDNGGAGENWQDPRAYLRGKGYRAPKTDGERRRERNGGREKRSNFEKR